MYTTPRTTHTSTGIFTNIKLYVTLLLSLLLVSCGGGGGSQAPITNVAIITAQVGANNSTVQVTNPTSGTYTVYVSNDIDCDTTNYSLCTNGQMESTPANDSTEFTTNALTLGGSPTFGILESATDNTTTFAISLDKFSKRARHQVVEIKGDLYLIGGYDGGSSYKNDVWKSTDNGQNWIEILPHNENPGENQFTERDRHQVVVLGEDMYLIGGIVPNVGRKNDVWKSSDGVTWDQILAHKDNPTSEDKQFSPRSNHQVVVKDDAMYLIGGFDGSRKNDVWKSSNGADWDPILPHNENPGDNQFTGRDRHQVVVTGDAMYLIGGDAALFGIPQNDVWKSSNGVDWDPILPYNDKPGDNQFSPRNGHQVVVIGDAMYLIGGEIVGNRRNNDVWKSTDGVTWTLTLAYANTPKDAQFTPRDAHQVVVNDGAMYLIGGWTTDGRKNDIWKSSDGETWQLVTNGAADFIPRDYHQVVEMNGDLYLIGGDDGKYTNDVWKSTDKGKSWVEISPHTDTLDNKFTARRGHQVVVKGDNMYLIGGYDGSKRFNDIWKSSDGKSWENILKQNDNADNTNNFSARDGHQVVVKDDDNSGAMYLIGGYDDSLKNDVWKSTNGVDWDRVLDHTTNPDENKQFSPRNGHRVVVIGDAMYLIGGSDSTTEISYTNDVWKSTNGVDWDRVLDHKNNPDSDDKQFSPRDGHQVVVTGSTMYLIGGNDGSKRFNDVWRSTDQGVTWEDISAHDANSNTKFAPRQKHQVVVVADGDDNTNTILVIGGSDGSNRFNDVWSSTDGSNWFLHVKVAVPLD